MNQRPILLVGAGGHCKALIDVIEQGDLFKIEGILDHPDSKITELLGYSIVGDDSSLSMFKQKFEYAFPAIGFLNKQVNRANLYYNLIELGYTIPNIISKRSYVSNYCKLGQGNAVLHDSILNAVSCIGSNATANPPLCVKTAQHVKSSMGRWKRGSRRFKMRAPTS